MSSVTSSKWICDAVVICYVLREGISYFYNTIKFIALCYNKLRLGRQVYKIKKKTEALELYGRVVYKYFCIAIPKSAHLYTLRTSFSK